MPIDRIEAADGIAQDDPPVRKSCQPFVMTLQTCREPLGGDVSYPLSVVDEVIQVWGMQCLSEGRKARGVARGVVPKRPAKVTCHV